MSISGIGAAGYPVTGYTAKKAERSAESGAVGFMETMAEKAGQASTVSGRLVYNNVEAPHKENQ